MEPPDVVQMNHLTPGQESSCDALFQLVVIPGQGHHVGWTADGHDRDNIGQQTLASPSGRGVKEM